MSLGNIRVVNKNRGSTVVAEPGETVIECDRRGNPTLGNKHFLANKHDTAARARVIEAHKRDLEQDLARDGPIPKNFARSPHALPPART